MILNWNFSKSKFKINNCRHFCSLNSSYTFLQHKNFFIFFPINRSQTKNVYYLYCNNTTYECFKISESKKKEEIFQ